MAREYTERWHHHQHIRDAVGRCGLKEPRFLTPVLDTFFRALPHTFRGTEAQDGTLVALTIPGAAGGQWFLMREGEKWTLNVEVIGKPHAEVIVDEDIAWRIFTSGLSEEEAQEQAATLGDESLGAKILDVVSIIA